MSNYETVIGLEVHTELSTKSKIFCSCSTEFGGDPNTHCCPICTGMPGTLPVLNKSVAEYAMRVGLATNCTINKYNKFDRKNYFYPDLPKAYQISQLYLPICVNGMVEIDVGGNRKAIRIKEIHMEEDAGKLGHDDWEDCTLADYNRCGVPLLEIVSEADFRSSAEVLAYLEKIRAILQYLDVSDCKMQEGSLRADVNVSVRPVGQKEYGTRTEMKNMNSLKAIGRAIDFESKRMIELLEEGKKVRQETRRWDDNKDASFPMRSKENAQDYRYFPEPDIPPVEVSDEWLNCIRESLPELPERKLSRYMDDLGLGYYDAEMIIRYKPMADFFEETNDLINDPKEISKWIMGELFRLLNDNGMEPSENPIAAKDMAALIQLVKNGKINRDTGKKVFEAMFSKGAEPERYVKDHDLEMVSDTGAVEAVVDEVICANPQSVEDFKNGKTKAISFLMGQCMKRLKGKANPKELTELLQNKLK